jgi:hypothetical protein
MSEMAHQKTDDELRHLLDEPGLWLIYGGGVLAEEDSLRKVLLHARDMLARGSSISEIVRTPGKGIVVPAPQILRLLELPVFATPKAVTVRKAKPDATRNPAGRKKRKATKTRSRMRPGKKAKAKPTSRVARRTGAARRTARSQSRRGRGR